MNQKKIKITISLMAFLSCLWISWVTLNPDQENPGIVRFLSLKDIHQIDASERVRLGGFVAKGTIDISEKNQLECNFYLKQGNNTISVLYTGTRPDLFKDEAEVIVEGIYDDGQFIADQLQTKCASRYEGDLRDESTYKLESI
tara:strand:+ start:655 stop:1083 length:429 start_codon:yes stop_codon:yes gene_type:complete